MCCRILAYSFEADWHCPTCTAARFPKDDLGHSEGIDREGNDIHPLFPWDEWWEPTEWGRQTLNCSDCGAELDVIETARGFGED